MSDRLTGSYLHSHVAKLRAERDELLEICEEVMEYLKISNGNTDITETKRNMMGRISAAIATSKEQA